MVLGFRLYRVYGLGVIAKLQDLSILEHGRSSPYGPPTRGKPCMWMLSASSPTATIPHAGLQQ